MVSFLPKRSHVRTTSYSEIVYMQKAEVTQGNSLSKKVVSIVN